MSYNHDKAKVTCPEAAAEVERLRALCLSKTDAITVMYCIESIQPRIAMDISSVELAWKIHSRLQQSIYGIPSTKEKEQ